MQRERTVLVMWEHTCEHSPIWSRSPDLDVGPIDARDLGLPDGLRDDLADWNERCEKAADPNDLLPLPASPATLRALGAESFDLAARVQRGLGDDWIVWCLAGGGDGALREPGAFGLRARTSGPHLLLDRAGVHFWTPSGSASALDRFGASLRREVRSVTASADRLPAAEYRATALDLAGRLHGSLAWGCVLWFGGGVP